MRNESASGLLVLVLTPLILALIVLNCVSWVLVRLHTGGLPVRKGLGWPWVYYTYEFARVGPSEWNAGALALDCAAGVGILLAAAALVVLYVKLRRKSSLGW
jgi:uncharacterized protein (TIGR03382 family)